MLLSQKLSAIIITKNEASNIERCLNSLQWIDEIVLVDSHSTDQTLEIARKYFNVKIVTTDWKGFTETKKIALSHTTHDWVLWIDADEAISKELETEIIEKVKKKSPLFFIYDCPRKTFFLGEWIRHTGWYPGKVKRLFHKRHCYFNDNTLHEGLETFEKVEIGHLQADLHHYSYASLYQYFDKMNFYGKYGAEELVRRNKKFHFWQLILNPAMSFIKFYILKKGFLDGKKGFIISIGSAFSNFIKYTNFYYLTRNAKYNHKQNR